MKAVRQRRRGALVGMATAAMVQPAGGTGHPGVDRVVGRTRSQDQQALGTIVDAVDARLVIVDDAQVRGVEAGLADRAHRLGGGEEVGEAEHGAAAKARPVLQPHPGLGDHAERTFRADDHAVGAGAGAGAGQPARLHDAGRRRRAQAFDEIVDMRVERREVAARAGGDPAAQGRELEALRVVADGEAVRPSAASSAGPWMPAWMRAARLVAVDLEHAIEAAQVEADDAGIEVADVRLDAADDRGAAAKGDDGELVPLAQSSTAMTSASLVGLATRSPVAIR